MKLDDYYEIDTSVIKEGLEFPFKIYTLDLHKDELSLFLFRHTKITAGDLRHMEEVRLFIPKSDLKLYNTFVDEHKKMLQNRDAHDRQYQGERILNQAQKLIQELFINPQAETVEKIRHLIAELITLILDEKFTTAALFELAATDYDTHAHSINVAIYALCLGKYLKLHAEDLQTLGEAAIMHDLGKSRIREDILHKHGILTHTEYEHMQKHAEWGEEIALGMGIDDEKILDTIRHHHERLDGSGYPDHLRGRHVALFARIVAICDIFDAVTTQKTYKNPVSSFHTLKMMKREMHQELDERILNSFILMLQQK